MKSYIDDDGRWVMEMRVLDAGHWSMITGQPAKIRRDFPWWKLWRWPALLLERRRCERMAAQGPLPNASIMGRCDRDSDRITHCVIDGMTFLGPKDLAA